MTEAAGERTAPAGTTPAGGSDRPESAIDPSAWPGSSAFAAAATRVRPADAEARDAAAHRHDRLTKPAGSLGRLEALGIQLAGIAGTCPPPRPRPAAVAVFAADHGVVAEGVTPWPREVTAQMVANFCAGGAAVNVLARGVGARVVVVDVGVATPYRLPDPPAPPAGGVPAGEDTGDGPGDGTGDGWTLRRRPVRAGTANLLREPAMTVDDAVRALDIGATVAGDLVAEGARCLITGEMGIGNTTPSAALVAAFTGRPAAEVTGRGTGIDDATWRHKVGVVEVALARHHAGDPDGSAGPLAVLASLGGLEIAALAGFVVGGVAARVPVVVDGVIADAALLAAEALVPGVVDGVIAGHRSSEPGATAALAHLGLAPLLDLGLRLGEGSGACLALPLIDAAAAVLRDMATFEDADVTER